MRAMATLTAALLLSSDAFAQAPTTADLLDLELGQLLALPVSVASRSEQRSGDVSAAVFVIDREALRRSGVQRLPDALRLVPGFHVGKWDANKWAIASRNGMARFTSTMLVLIDGRPAYTPLFGGVRWETLDLPLGEVERIEVVRGPGGPLWGANAVDGIVSIVTRDAAATVGESVRLALGDGDIERLAEASIGREAAGWHWRLGVRYLDSAPGTLPDVERSVWTAPRAVGDDARDEGRFRSAMLRVDGPADTDGGRWRGWLGHREGEFNDQRVVGNQTVDNRNRFTLDYGALEWSNRPAAAQTLTVRASVEHMQVADAVLEDDQRVADVDLQHDGRSGAHEWSWGVGLNHYRSDTRTPARFATATAPACMGCFGADPQRATDTKRSLYVQDRIALHPDWRLVLGAKLEDARGLDWDWQPTLRLRWQPDGGHTLWAAWTRALRSSTRLERDGAFFNVPDSLAPLFGCRSVDAGACRIGSPDQPPWRIEVKELGWRWQATDALAFDLSAFDSRFRDQTSTIVGARDRDRVTGAELAAQWTPTATLRIDGWASVHRGEDRLIGSPGARPDTPLLPRHSQHLHVQWTPADNVDLDLRWWAIGERRTVNARIGSLPAYRRVDLRLAWRPAPGWETALAIGNANDGLPVEYVESLRVNTAVPRSVTLSVAKAWP